MTQAITDCLEEEAQTVAGDYPELLKVAMGAISPPCRNDLIVHIAHGIPKHIEQR